MRAGRASRRRVLPYWTERLEGRAADTVDFVAVPLPSQHGVEVEFWAAERMLFVREGRLEQDFAYELAAQELPMLERDATRYADACGDVAFSDGSGIGVVPN